MAERSEVKHWPATREGWGESWTWARVLGGKPYRFNTVLMPNGERRVFVHTYNGYADDGTERGRFLAQRYGCAWSPCLTWIIKP